MHDRRAIAPGIVALVVLMGLPGRAWAGPLTSIGPDIVVTDLYELLHWGASSNGSIHAYSVGTYACNIGDAPAIWQGNTDQHPVIGQNLFRLSEGRLDHIGQSWLKWAFQAANTDYCGDCNDPGSSQLLGVNCADPYSAGFNGYQLALGPKSVVNPFTGEFPASHATPPGNVIGGRLQVRTTDLNSIGALYFVEGQYVSPDDSAFANLHNNTSYRQVWIQPNYSLTFISPQGQPSTTVQQQPGIAVWAQQDPTVFLNFIDVPDDGRLYVARKATDLGAGNWHYEIAVHNVNSDRAVGEIFVWLPTGASAGNQGAHYVEYHSGEIYDGAPWTASVTPTGLRWNTVAHDTNPNANALRWGTLYNFWFDAAAPPVSVTLAELTLFKPGTPASVEVRIGPVPALPGDLNCDGLVDFGDINPFVLVLTDVGSYESALPYCYWLNADCNGDDSVDFGDINPFVQCVSNGACP